MLPEIMTYIWAAFIILVVLYFLSRSLFPGLMEQYKALVALVILFLTLLTFLSPISSVPSDILLSPGVGGESKYMKRVTTQMSISDPKSLEEIPLEIGSWSGMNIQGPQYVNAVAVMGGELLLQRGYHNDKGTFTWMLIMYGPRSATFHDAEACYYLTGWSILGKGVEPFVVPNTELEVYAKRLRVMRGVQQRLLFYWTMEKPGPGGRVVGIRVGTFVPVGDWQKADMELRDLVEHLYQHLYEAGEHRPLLVNYLLGHLGNITYGIIAAFILIPQVIIFRKKLFKRI